MERARKAAVCKARTLFDPKLYAVFFYCALTFAHLAKLILQLSGARFAFVARKLETLAGRNCSVQFRRFQQRFPATVHKINVELVSPRLADLPYAK
jgi:hypothetical protein